jgi:hypothetical protein
MGCSVMVFMDEFLIFFNIILCLPVLDSPKRSSANTQVALKWECHSEITVQLKEPSPKASEPFQRFQYLIYQAPDQT